MSDEKRTLIEAILRKTLREIKKSPERATRNIIDFGIHFAKGDHYSPFLKTVQKILSDESNAYFPLVYDTVMSVDEDRLLTFGMNLGYSSFTSGANTIRKIESEEKYNIPWMLFLEIGDLDISVYESLIDQGNQLGIYSWIIRLCENSEKAFQLMKKYKDNAFILRCPSKAITDNFISKSLKINNMMIAVEYDENTFEKCDILRENRLLYSMYYVYSSKDRDFIVNGELESTAKVLHPLFTLIQPKSDCDEESRRIVYKYINDSRHKGKTNTVFWDVHYDSLYVDGIISDNPCSAGFLKNGEFISFNDYKVNAFLKIPETRLSEILKTEFPK